MIKLAVLVSGGGTNLQAILDAMDGGYLTDKIAVVVSSKDTAYAISRAKERNIPIAVIERKAYETQEAYDEALLHCLAAYDVDLVVLAGFLVILGQRFIKAYPDRIINVHPSLIPAFCGNGHYGLIPHEKALSFGVKITGATVHFVQLETDQGPILLQEPVRVFQDDTPHTLQKRVMEQAEWKILPKAIKLISEGRVRVVGRKVWMDGEESV
jgi:phosphoribosylglycinamide formyltransferase 1